MSMQFYKQTCFSYFFFFLATLEMLKMGLQIPTGDISSYVHLLYCVWEKTTYGMTKNSA